MSTQPLVSVGLPVRNGGARLAQAIDSVVRQTFPRLEILISDNASTDETATIGQAAAERDARVRYVRHDRPISALRNFRYVFEAASGDFFMWAAHDDLRTFNYVEVLLRGLTDNPRASLAFSDVVLFDDPDDAGNLCPLSHRFDNTGADFHERLRRCAHTAPLHVYGLLRASALRGYPWYETDTAPDWPLMMWLACRGDFIHVPGALFGYSWRCKSEAERARANALRDPGPAVRERMAWVCTDAAVRAEAASGRRRYRPWLLPRIYVWQHRGFRNLLFTRAPRPLQRAWTSLRRRVVSVVVACPLCGPSPARRWRRHNGFSILRCRGCALLVTWPRPSARELAAFYDRADYYDAHAMGADAAEAWVERAREILQRVPLAVARAVDVGAGEGHAVAALRALGVHAEGVEPSPAARAAALAQHGLRLAPDLAALDVKPCELVTFIHSLEHVTDPVAALRAAASRLRPGGVVFVEVPHAGSIELWTRRGRDQILQLPAHLYHFTPATLARVVERAGLEVIAVYGSNPALLERLFAWRARRRGLRAVTLGASAGTLAAAPARPGDGARAPRGWRRLWATRVLPWLRERFPGYKFQLVARAPLSDVPRSQ